MHYINFNVTLHLSHLDTMITTFLFTKCRIPIGLGFEMFSGKIPQQYCSQQHSLNTNIVESEGVGRRKDCCMNLHVDLGTKGEYPLTRIDWIFRYYFSFCIFCLHYTFFKYLQGILLILQTIEDKSLLMYIFVCDNNK